MKDESAGALAMHLGINVLKSSKTTLQALPARRNDHIKRWAADKCWPVLGLPWPPWRAVTESARAARPAGSIGPSHYNMLRLLVDGGNRGLPHGAAIIDHKTNLTMDALLYTPSRWIWSRSVWFRS